MDRSTKRTSIILAIMVTLVTVLFIVGAVHDTDEGGSGCSPTQRETWRKRWLGDEALAPGQLSGCTSALGSFLVINEHCELKIAAADAFRQVTIQALDAAIEIEVEIELSTHADGGSLTMKGTIDGGKEQQISIGKDGQTIKIRCKTGTTCQASVK